MSDRLGALLIVSGIVLALAAGLGSIGLALVLAGLALVVFPRVLR